MIRWLIPIILLVVFCTGCAYMKELLQDRKIDISISCDTTSSTIASDTTGY